MARDIVALDTERFCRLVEEQGIKHWLLARLLGVDRKTVYRWLSGRTQRISREHRDKLCVILGCDAADLEGGQALKLLATRSDRWEAARRIQEANLAELVAPTGDWGLAESLLRSLIDPAMPHDLQARLYYLLCSMYLRLSRFEMMRQSAQLCIEHAQAGGTRQLEIWSRIMIATADSRAGSIVDAIEQYDRIIADLPADYPQAARAPLLSNLASMHHWLGDFETSHRIHQEALRLWPEYELNHNHCIGLYLYAEALTENSLDAQTEAAIDACSQVAQRAHYSDLLDDVEFLRADLLSGRGDLEAAIRIVDERLPRLLARPDFSLHQVEIAMRALRLAGQLERAAQLYAEASGKPNEENYALARLQMERARLALTIGDEAAALSFSESANQRYLQVGATGRIRPGLPVEYRT